MSRRLLATVRNHEVPRCAKVYRDRTLQQYVVVFIPGPGEPRRQEHRTDSREDAFRTAWAFPWHDGPA